MKYFKHILTLTILISVISLNFIKNDTGDTFEMVTKAEASCQYDDFGDYVCDGAGLDDDQPTVTSNPTNCTSCKAPTTYTTPPPTEQPQAPTTPVSNWTTTDTNNSWNRPEPVWNTGTNNTSPVETTWTTGNTNNTTNNTYTYTVRPVTSGYTWSGVTYTNSPTNSWGSAPTQTQQPTYRPQPTYNPPVVYNTQPQPSTPNAPTAPSSPQIVCPVNYTVNSNRTGCDPNQKSCTDGSRIAFYQECTKICWSGTMAGQRIPENQNCPVQNVTGGGATQTYVYTCWNGQVVQTSSQCPVQNQTCSNGQNIPVTQTCPAATQTCWNGSVVSASQACPAQTKTCQNGQVVQLSQTCTKNCPSGAVINENQTCPATTKTCRDGRIVSISSECLRSCPDGSSINENYTCPAIIRKDHSVMTTVATQITQNSGRCNGVSVIERGINSTGYFEYSDNPSFANPKITNSGNIGSNNSVSYANTINALKPDTTYYCRAVMTNTDGTYKGQIVNFRTLAEEVKYIPPVQERIREIRTTVTKEIVTTKSVAASKVSNTQNSVKKVVTKTPAKTTVTCKDSSGNTNELGLDDKFVKLDFQRLTNQVSAGKEVKYNLNYTNTSNINLENGIIKISIPKEMDYISSKMGEYDKNTNTLTIDLGNIKAKESDSFDIILKVKDGIQNGKSLVVSSLITYEMLDENGARMSDENTGYDISTVSEYVKDNTISTNSTKGVDNKSFLDSWLFKIIVSIILLFVLFILGKNIYNRIRHKRYENNLLESMGYDNHTDGHGVPANDHH